MFLLQFFCNFNKSKTQAWDFLFLSKILNWRLRIWKFTFKSLVELAGLSFVMQEMNLLVVFGSTNIVGFELNWVHYKGRRIRRYGIRGNLNFKCGFDLTAYLWLKRFL